MSIKFGTILTKSFVNGAIAGAGFLAPWVIAGVVIKRKVRMSVGKVGDDFLTSLMKKVEEIANKLDIYESRIRALSLNVVERNQP